MDGKRAWKDVNFVNDIVHDNMVDWIQVGTFGINLDSEIVMYGGHVRWLVVHITEIVVNDFLNHKDVMHFVVIIDRKAVGYVAVYNDFMEDDV